MQRFICLCAAAALVLAGCGDTPSAPDAENVSETIETQVYPHAEWTKDATIYEVNIRQHTPEGTFDAFTRDIPEYQAQVNAQLHALFLWLGDKGVSVTPGTLSDIVNPGAVIGLAGDLFNSFGGLLANAFLIFLTVVFILFEASGLPEKLERMSGNAERSLDRFRHFTGNLRRYLAIKSLASLGTGAAVALWLWLLGVDYPILWGMLAFLLNYVPNIGSIIAAVPAVLLAAVQLGAGAAGATAVGYVVINVLVGSIIEPRFMGRGLGLSTLVVFLSLVFWGWVLGPVGMFLSVPLTMTAKIALESREDTRWIAVLLGPSPPEDGPQGHEGGTHS